MNYLGTTGNDTFNGTTAADLFDLTRGGNDTVFGDLGKDIFDFGATWTLDDVIDGGDSVDTLLLTGDYSSGITFGNASVRRIEEFRFGAGYSYNLTVGEKPLNGGNWTIDASALVAGQSVYFDGALATSIAFTFFGGRGANTFIGSGKDDAFVILGGSTNTLIGGKGDDEFSVQGTPGTLASIDGGEGIDKVAVSGATTFDTAGVRGVEAFRLFNGSPHVIVNDATVAAGQQIAVSVDTGVTDRFVFDGSAETDGRFSIQCTSLYAIGTIRGGAGDDTITGLRSNALINGAIDGGGGYDSVQLMGRTAGFMPDTGEVRLRPDSLQNVEELVLDHVYMPAPHNWKWLIVPHDANVAAGATLRVDATALRDNNISSSTARTRPTAISWWSVARTTTGSSAVQATMNSISTPAATMWREGAQATTCLRRAPRSPMPTGSTAATESIRFGSTGTIRRSWRSARLRCSMSNGSNWLSATATISAPPTAMSRPARR